MDIEEEVKSIETLNDKASQVLVEISDQRYILNSQNPASDYVCINTLSQLILSARHYKELFPDSNLELEFLDKMEIHEKTLLDLFKLFVLGLHDESSYYFNDVLDITTINYCIYLLIRDKARVLNGYNPYECFVEASPFGYNVISEKTFNEFFKGELSNFSDIKLFPDFIKFFPRYRGGEYRIDVDYHGEEDND